MTDSTADINAWVELLAEFAEAIGAPKSKDSLYTLFFNKAMEGDAEGGGTIHDIARFCAHERGLRLVSCPTAASVDGFCSTVSAMTWHGYKKTIPAVAPEIVAADTEIIQNAPPGRSTASPI